MAKTSNSATQKRRRGKHGNSNSLANLNRSGSKPRYEKVKENHSISATPTGWEGFKGLASRLELSASQFVESQGRGEIDLTLTIEAIYSPETLTQLNLSPTQLLQMPLLDVLYRLAVLKKRNSVILS